MDEPKRHPLFMVLLGLCALGTAPLLFVGRATTNLLGLPLWLWSSILFTLGLSGMVTWGVLAYWHDPEANEGDAPTEDDA